MRVFTGTKLAWPPLSGLPSLQRLRVRLAVPCLGERTRAGVSSNLLLDAGDASILGDVGWDFRILLHILKLTSEYLSTLHQPALLTPKSGLWEKSNCLL